MIIPGIAKREALNLFISPLAWTVLAVMLMVQGLIFYRLTQAHQLLDPQSTPADPAALGITYNIASLSMGSASYIAMLAIPILTMFLISGERQSNTFPLLMSAPVTSLQIILGKYFGILLFIMAALILLSCMPLILLTGGSLDLGMYAASVTGIGLLMASYAALGLLMSCITSSPALAAFSTMGALVMFWILELMAGTGISILDSLLEYLSMLKHFEPMLRGIVDSRDVSYFILFICACIGLAVFRLNQLRISDE
jgi:ABC-2 type transport system permease protein